MEESYLSEHLNESPLVRRLRAAVLLGTMILIPGVAVCWNLLPKQHYEPETFSEPIPTSLPDIEEPEPFDDVACLSSLPVPLLLQAAPIRMEYGPVEELNLEGDADFLPLASVLDRPIEAMNLEAGNQVETNPIPSTLEEPCPLVVTQVSALSSSVAPQRSFPLLESELHALGARYYRLEKWGNRGELFRFSCYVDSAEPYRYQKLFQEIDSDEIRVMEQVIADIRMWKGKRE